MHCKFNCFTVNFDRTWYGIYIIYNLISNLLYKFISLYQLQNNYPFASMLYVVAKCFNELLHLVTCLSLLIRQPSLTLLWEWTSNPLIINSIYYSIIYLEPRAWQQLKFLRFRLKLCKGKILREIFECFWWWEFRQRF